MMMMMILARRRCMVAMFTWLA